MIIIIFNVLKTISFLYILSLFVLLKDPIDIKKATGIPRGFLVPVDGPSVPGAMLTGLGTFAVPSIDQYVHFV